MWVLSRLALCEGGSFIYGKYTLRIKYYIILNNNLFKWKSVDQIYFYIAFILEREKKRHSQKNKKALLLQKDFDVKMVWKKMIRR